MFMDQTQPEADKYYDIAWILKLSDYMCALWKDIKSKSICLHVSLYISQKRIDLSDWIWF